MSDHHFSTGHRDPASLEAERLIEQRLAELRAVALGETPAPAADSAPVPSAWTPVEPTVSDDPLAAVLHPVAQSTSREPAPRLTVVPVRTAAEYHPAPRQQAPALPPAAPVQNRAHQPAPTYARADAPVPAPALATSERAQQRMTSAASDANLAGLITASVSRVEFAVQEDISRLEELLRSWGAPSEQVMAGMQRVERSLRAELARVLEAVHTVPVNEASVIDRLADFTDDVNARTGARFDAVRAELEHLAQRLEEQTDIATRAAGSAAAIAGSGIGERLSRTVRELADPLTLRVEALHSLAQSSSIRSTEQMAEFSETLRASRAELTDARLRDQQLVDLVDASFFTLRDDLNTLLGGDLETLELIADAVGRAASTGERIDDLIERTTSSGELIEDLSKRATSTGERIENLIERTTLSGEGIEDLSKRATSTGERIEDLFELADKRLVDIEQSADSRHTQLEQSMDSLSDRVHNALARLDEAAQVHAHDQQLDGSQTEIVAELDYNRVKQAQDTELVLDTFGSGFTKLTTHMSSIERRLDGQLTTPAPNSDEATADLREYLEQRLDELEDTLLVAQDDVPEELNERVTELVNGLAVKVDASAAFAARSANASVSGITDAVSGITHAVGSVTHAVSALRDQIRNDLGSVTFAQGKQLDQAQTELVSEIDYNRVKQAQDTELVLDTFGTGFTTMASRMSSIERRLDQVSWQLEQIVATQQAPTAAPKKVPARAKVAPAKTTAIHASAVKKTQAKATKPDA